MRRSQLSEMFLAEGPRYAPVQQVSITSAFRMRTFGVNGDSFHIVQLPLESTVACPCESDPPFDLWHNICARVDKTARIQKLRCLSIPLACCFDDNR